MNEENLIAIDIFFLSLWSVTSHTICFTLIKKSSKIEQEIQLDINRPKSQYK